MTPNKRRKTSLLRRGHYWLGLGLALPLVMLAISGVLLNHSDDLNLDKRYSGYPLLLKLYGIKPAAPETGYPLAGHWVTQARDSLWLDAKKLDTTTRAPLVGAARLDNLLVVAQPAQLRVYTRDGRNVEHLDLPPTRTPISAITAHNGRLLLRGTHGVFSTTSDFAAWSDTTQPWPNIGATQQALPPQLRKRIARQLAADTLTWEKILLDLHSGRIFGSWGPYCVDAVALITLALAITGCMLWLRRGGRR